MMHPELMHIIVEQLQAERRQQAREPIDPFVGRIARSAKYRLGSLIIRLGIMLGGNAQAPVRDTTPAPEPAT